MDAHVAEPTKAAGQPSPEDAPGLLQLIATLERREHMQRALAGCSQRLVTNAADPAEERAALQEALEHLRAGSDLLRVGLWENCIRPELGPASCLYAEAFAAGERSHSERFGEDYTLPWASEQLRQALESGKHIGGPVAELFADSPQTLAVQRQLGIGATQLFAVFLDGACWGHLAFDDREERTWDEHEVLLIRTAAEIVGSFLTRNRAAAALREREATLSALGDHLPDAFIYQLEERPDGQYRRTYLSRGLEQRTGVRAEQALADVNRLPITIHPDDLPTYERLRDTARAQVAPYENEHRYIAADGSVRWVRARTSPRTLPDGRMLWDGVAFDTTVYHQLQESLRQANAGLSRRVDELALLNRIATLLGNTRELQATLTLVCRLLRESFHAQEVLLALREPGSDGLRVFAYELGAQTHGLPGYGVLHPTAAGIAEHAGMILLETGHAADDVALLVALRAQDAVIGLLQVRVAHGQQQLTPEVVSMAQTVAGTIAGAVSNVWLYERAVASSDRLERLNAVSRMVNSAGLELPALYAAIHQAVAYLMPVEAFVIYLVEAAGTMADIVYQYDCKTGLSGPARDPLCESFAGFMRRYGPSLRVDDFELFYQQHPELVFHVFGDGEDTLSGLATSFVTADGLYGVLFAQCYPRAAYTDDDLLALELLTAHAATAIENARRAQRERRRAIDAERNRLARDLHDSVSQSLFAAGLIAERLPVVAQSDPEAAWQALDPLRDLVDGALTEMRALLIELRPAALADAPLDEAIARLAQSLSARRGPPVSTDLAPAPQLALAVQLAFYRIVQECLSNLLKHAQARSAHIALLVEPPVADRGNWSGTVTIRVRDDGCGFDPEAVGADRLGLGIMHERAAEIGARLLIRSAASRGTLVELVWSGRSAKE